MQVTATDTDTEINTEIGAEIDAETAERHGRWLATSHGHDDQLFDGARTPHHNGHVVTLQIGKPLSRVQRERAEDSYMRGGATRARKAGERVITEEPDPYRTCYEVDRDRITDSPQFRRLAQVKQAFLFPAPTQRTRLDHTLEVAGIARRIATPLRLNATLAEAIALGHDCGHAPGGHAGEDALSPYVEQEFDHAVWGADETLPSLNLCTETLDGIRNHSWSRPCPSTPEAQVVSIADRVAYVTHDLEDARTIGIDWVTPDAARILGDEPTQWRDALIGDAIVTTARFGAVSISPEALTALGSLRSLCNKAIYMRPASEAENAAIVDVIRFVVESLVEDHEPLGVAVRRVAAMTDREVCDRAVELGYKEDALPLTTVESSIDQS